MHWLAHFIREALEQWGYLALAIGLLGEDAGLPMPGETLLMYASFLAGKSNRLGLAWLILVGIAAAVAGDNVGFWIGRRLGPHLLDWLRRKFHMDDDIDAACDQIKKHGKPTVFFAKYIFGLRTIAGPVAGALKMEWRSFLIYNGLGTATWVVLVSVIGYAFAKEFDSLLSFIEKCSWGISAALVGTGWYLWRRKKKRFLKEKKSKEHESAA